MDINELITNIENINLNDYNSELYLFSGLKEKMKLFLLNIGKQLDTILLSSLNKLKMNFKKKSDLEDYSLGKAKYENLIRFDLKECIDVWNSINEKIINNSSNKIDNLASMTGYFFRLSNNNKNIFIFFKKNPIIASAKSKNRFIFFNNTLKPYDLSSQIFNFGESPHFIIIDDVLYTTNLYFEDVFGLEDVSFSLGQKRLEEIKKIEFLDDNFIDFISKLKKSKIKSLASLKFGYINVLNEQNIVDICKEFELQYDDKNKKILCKTKDEMDKLYKVLTNGTIDKYTNKKTF